MNGQECLYVREFSAISVPPWTWWTQPEFWLTAHGQCHDADPLQGRVTWEDVKEGDVRSDKDQDSSIKESNFLSTDIASAQCTRMHKGNIHIYGFIAVYHYRYGECDVRFVHCLIFCRLYTKTDVCQIRESSTLGYTNMIFYPHGGSKRL